MSSEEMDIAECDETNDNEMVEHNETEEKKVYLPGQPLEDGEKLVMDKSVYVMYHQAQTSSPCLSFDIIYDNLGDNRENFPLTAYIVAGTQAPQSHVNNVIVMKLSNLHKTCKDDDDDDSEDDDEDESKQPKMSGALIKHQGTVNRIRATALGETVLAATWSELGTVNIWDISTQLNIVNNETLLEKNHKENASSSTTPVFTFMGHQKEGYALDWCTTTPGMLATGDCKRDIHIWKPNNTTSWTVDQRPLIGHTDSVEDIQWSPNEKSVLASCSIDRSIRIWDVRAAPSKACMLTADKAHENDVNVINWNKNEPFIVSGGDDGIVHVWDLRKFKDKYPLATFKHHTESVVSVEWHQTDSAVFASAGADNQIALWDLSVEKDTESSNDSVEDLPPQLLFIHQGQNNIKELHWHPQLPGVIISTAESGFNIFRTISV